MDAGAKPTWMYLRRPRTKHSGVKSRIANETFLQELLGRTLQKSSNFFKGLWRSGGLRLAPNPPYIVLIFC
jgi:hypothetical protein